jgi:hypothetical protein
MWSRRGVRADRGAGLANDDEGMMIRGDSGREPLREECALELDVVVLLVVFDSSEVVREREG